MGIRPHQSRVAVARQRHGIAEKVTTRSIRRCQLLLLAPASSGVREHIRRSLIIGVPIDGVEQRPHQSRVAIARQRHGNAELVVIYPIRGRKFRLLAPASSGVREHIRRPLNLVPIDSVSRRPQHSRIAIARQRHGIPEPVTGCAIRRAQLRLLAPVSTRVREHIRRSLIYVPIDCVPKRPHHSRVAIARQRDGKAELITSRPIRRRQLRLLHKWVHHQRILRSSVIHLQQQLVAVQRKPSRQRTSRSVVGHQAGNACRCLTVLPLQSQSSSRRVQLCRRVARKRQRQGERQVVGLSGGLSRRLRERESLLQSQWTVDVPLRQRSPFVLDSIRLGLWSSLPDRNTLVSITIAAQREPPPRTLTVDLDPVTSEVQSHGVPGILRMNAAWVGMKPVAGIVPSQRSGNGTLRGRRKAGQAARTGCRSCFFLVVGGTLVAGPRHVPDACRGYVLRLSRGGEQGQQKDCHATHNEVLRRRGLVGETLRGVRASGQGTHGNVSPGGYWCVIRFRAFATNPERNCEAGHIDRTADRTTEEDPTIDPKPQEIMCGGCRSVKLQVIAAVRRAALWH